ncbi:hypothetical protein GCM10027446_09760 [Angustibacter peucedani]
MPSATEPEALLQVRRVDDRTVLLRQSKAVTFEAPFLYLLLGDERALLLDTGATSDPATFPLRATVDGLVEEWLAEHPHDGYELVVAHTHAHGDHVAGDAQLADRPRTTVVGHAVEAVRTFFDLPSWPQGRAALDLGGRVLDVVPLPGHHPAHVAFFDPVTGWLLTGDSVYPGRVYVRDPQAFADSLDRLVQLADEREVTAVMGCHVEMSTTPYRDYPVGARHQPQEAPLPMTVEQLRRVRDAAHRFRDAPGVHREPDFHLWVGPCRRAALWHVVRLLWSRAQHFSTKVRS